MLGVVTTRNLNRPYHTTHTNEEMAAWEIEFVEARIQFQLHGKADAVSNNRFGEVGMRLMNEMWRIVKESNTATTDINHWV
jgi:hypothetical protein